MFVVQVERVFKQKSRHKLGYEYTYKVDFRPTNCDFVAQFAELVAKLGKSPAIVFATRMGIDEQQLVVTLATLTGAGVREWCDTFAYAVGEALLRETDWSVESVAHAVGFSSTGLFSRFWRKKYKCTPRQWRWMA